MFSSRDRDAVRHGSTLDLEHCMTETEDDAERFSDPAADAAVTVPIEDSIDLHAYAPEEIPDVVGSYLEAAVAAGFREVRIIHGRGTGVQRRRVQSTLGRHPLVETFRDAPADRGGWGATLAYLIVTRGSSSPPPRPE